MTTLEDHFLKMEKVEITGYSTEEVNTHMCTVLNRLTHITDKTITYTFDAKKAQVGSGVWTSVYGEPYLLGVHTEEENVSCDTKHQTYPSRSDKRSVVFKAIRLNAEHFNQFIAVIAQTIIKEQSYDQEHSVSFSPRVSPAPPSFQFRPAAIAQSDRNHTRIDVINEQLPEGAFNVEPQERQRSVDVRDPKLLCVLANTYYAGNGAPQDYTKAVELYTLSANQGYAEAQHALGLCYYDGTGVDVNTQKALELFTLAANKGYPASQYMLGVFHMNELDIEKNEQKSIEWYTKAAEKGHMLAQYNLAQCYANGTGVPLDYLKAICWWINAGNQGHSQSLYNIGNCYYLGTGIPKDRIMAVKWYKKAAIIGHAEAQYLVGQCYEKGDGIAQDNKKAVEFYTKAAKQDHILAQKALANCYRRAIGVYKDEAMAQHWQTKARELEKKAHNSSVTCECNCVVS